MQIDITRKEAYEMVHKRIVVWHSNSGEKKQKIVSVQCGRSCRKLRRNINTRQCFQREWGKQYRYIKLQKRHNHPHLLPFLGNHNIPHVKYWTISQATNKVGLWTAVSSSPFLYDSTPPTQGFVRFGKVDHVSMNV